MNKKLYEQETIKAITLWQPWASLMVNGIKFCETRSWESSYRGIIAIHAAKRMDQADEAKILLNSRTIGARVRTAGIQDFNKLPFGQIIGFGLLQSIAPSENFDLGQVPAREIICGDWTAGRFIWLINPIIQLRIPIMARGAQKLWNYNPPAPVVPALNDLFSKDQWGLIPEKYPEYVAAVHQFIKD